MKTRHYLHEDLAQIRYYFPSAHAVRINTVRFNDKSLVSIPRRISRKRHTTSHGQEGQVQWMS